MKAQNASRSQQLPGSFLRAAQAAEFYTALLLFGRPQRGTAAGPPNALRPNPEFSAATCKNLQLFRNPSPLSNGQAG